MTQSIVYETEIPLRRKVYLVKLANRIGVPADMLVNVLIDHGYLIKGKSSNIALDDYQLDIIGNAYFQWIKNWHKKIGKRFAGLPHKWQVYYTQTFQRLINNGENVHGQAVFNQELDHYRVKELFMALVETSHISQRRQRKFHPVKIKWSIRKTYSSISRKVISTFINYHFYNFSMEEEPQRTRWPLASLAGE